MSKLKDLTGQTFGALTVVGRGPNTPRGQATWNCRCACGKVKTINGEHLRNGVIKSCGCRAQYRDTPKATKHPYYATWKNMKSRCDNPHNHAYKDYGGRGIKVCDRWASDFWAFVRDMGAKPSTDYSLDRIDSSKGYSPDNCRWASRTTQSRNKRGRSDSSIQVKGVSKHGASYRALIGVGGKNINLGTFPTIEQAAKARKEAEMKYWSGGE